jgi:Flp pilus assembly protein TadG
VPSADKDSDLSFEHEFCAAALIDRWKNFLCNLLIHNLSQCAIVGQNVGATGNMYGLSGKFIPANLALDKRGNFAVVGALILPLILLALGVAIDQSSAEAQKLKLQGIADSASVAAASALIEDHVSNEKATEIALSIISGQLKLKSNVAMDLRYSERSKPTSHIADTNDCTSVQIKDMSRQDGSRTYTVTVNVCEEAQLSVLNSLSQNLQLKISAASTSVSEFQFVAGQWRGAVRVTQ